MTRRRSILRALVLIVAVALFAVPVVALAAPEGPTPNQRIDLKVLLLTPTATDGVFSAWKETLGKLGVPYDTYDASDVGRHHGWHARRLQRQSLVLPGRHLRFERSRAQRQRAHRGGQARDHVRRARDLRQHQPRRRPRRHRAGLRRDDRAGVDRERQPDRRRQDGVPVSEGRRPAHGRALRGLGHPDAGLHLAGQRSGRCALRRRIVHGHLEAPERHRAARRRHPRQRSADATTS